MILKGTPHTISSVHKGDFKEQRRIKFAKEVTNTTEDTSSKGSKMIAHYRKFINDCLSK